MAGTTSTDILLSWSGGKDCLMALQALQGDPAWRVAGLLTTVTVQYDRVAMHGVRRDILQAQARALDLPLVTAELAWPSSNDAYERAFADALVQARQRWPGIGHLAFGDLFLADVRAYRERQLEPMGWEAVFPVWGHDTATLARRFIAEGHRATLCCVDTTQLDGRFAGHAFDDVLLAALPSNVDPCGERGEFHTLSHGGPLFDHDLRIRPGESVLRDARLQYQDFILDD